MYQVVYGVTFKFNTFIVITLFKLKYINIYIIIYYYTL